MSKYDEMTKSSVKKLVMRLSLPTIISMLVTSLYNMADTYFVSQLGDSPSAAISVVFSIMTLIQSLGYTIGMGCGSMLSRCLGSKDDNGANKHASQGFLMALVLGGLFTLFGLIFRSELITLIGATDSAKPYAIEYVTWVIIACPFMMTSFVMNNILRSEGKPYLSMIGLGFGGLLNIVLDPLLINTLNLGIAGAGIATMISQIISFIILLSFFIFHKSTTRLGLGYISLDWKSYWEALKCGLPTLVRQGCGTTSNIILSFLGKPYGDAVVAALGVTNKIYMICRNIVIGFGQGFIPIIGYNYGAKKYGRIKEGFIFTMSLQTTFCLLATAIILIFPGKLIALFRDTPEVIEVGTKAIRMLAISLPFLGFSTIVNQCLQVMGYVKSATLLASCRQGIIYTPLIFALEHFFGTIGLSLTQPCSDFITALISIPFCIYLFHMLSDKREKQIDVLDN